MPMKLSVPPIHGNTWTWKPKMCICIFFSGWFLNIPLWAETSPCLGETLSILQSYGSSNFPGHLSIITFLKPVSVEIKIINIILN